jgi:hypothetical protein
MKEALFLGNGLDLDTHCFRNSHRVSLDRPEHVLSDRMRFPSLWPAEGRAPSVCPKTPVCVAGGPHDLGVAGLLLAHPFEGGIINVVQIR